MTPVIFIADCKGGILTTIVRVALFLLTTSVRDILSLSHNKLVLVRVLQCLEIIIEVPLG